MGKEIWKTLSGYTTFEGSNIGKIRNIKSGNVYKIYIRKDGRCQVNLREGSKTRPEKVHRLIAKAFIPNPENKSQVNHKNGNQSDNRVINLEWATPSENTKHAFDVLGHTPINQKKVLCLTNGIEYPSAMEAARRLKLNSGNLSSVCRGLYKSTKGFEFKYL